MKNKIKTIVKWIIENNIIIYWKEIIFLILLFFSFKYNFIHIDNFILYRTAAADIIIVLLPLVLTILSITLALPKEKIYSINSTKFRRLRSKGTYDFNKMMFITVLIFVFFAIAKIFDLILVIWTLDLMTVIYSVIFLNQEIPLLIHDDKKIKKIIRKNIHKKDINISLGYVSRKVDLNNAVQNILLTEGIDIAYKTIKTNDSAKNKEYFDFLLNLQNNYLWNYKENYTLSLESFSKEFQDISILEAIDTSINNINDIIRLNNELNIVKIYGDDKHFFHITRSIFFLYSILKKLKLDNKINKEFSKIIKNICIKIKFDKINASEKTFLYNTLNGMVINTLSNNELWFIELLRNSVFNEVVDIYCDNDYMIFISIYLYYFAKVENRVENKFKSEIINFINQPYKGESWAQILKNKLSYINSDEAINLLPKLLAIYDCNNDNLFSWYRPSENNSKINSMNYKSVFSKQMIINWWLGYIVTNQSLYAKILNKRIEFKLPDLDETNKAILIKELNKEWFIDDKLKEEINLAIFEFYKLNNKVYEYQKNSEIVKSFIDFKNEYNKNKIMNEIKKELQEEDLERHKLSLIKGFENAVKELTFLDKSIKLSQEEKKYFSIEFDARFSDELVKLYAEGMPRTISKLVHDDFISNAIKNKIKKEIDFYNTEVLNEIVEFNPTMKNAYIYKFEKNVESKQLIEKIYKIPSIEKIWLPNDLFIKNEAIKINIEIEKEDTIVRRYTPEEVNIIIDRDYKLVNGLYKYVDGSDKDTNALLEREEIFEVISKKFFIAIIIFKYKINYDYENMLYYELKDK